jgi:hypothetical protein
MSDVIVIAVVVFVNLLLVSFMVLIRLRAGAPPPRDANMLIAEMWLTVGVVAAMFFAIARLLGEPGAARGAGIELADIGRRFAALSVESKWLLGIGGALTVALFAHLLYSISRAMRAAPPS